MVKAARNIGSDFGIYKIRTYRVFLFF